MKRVYDAQFASTNGSHPMHLGTFWWIEGTAMGQWSREQAHDYVVAHPKSVYVSEGQNTVWVLPYHHTNNTVSRWIQTVADGSKEDNLVTLAKRHAAGLPNR